jgi:hypothetical protein
MKGDTDPRVKVVYEGLLEVLEPAKHDPPAARGGGGRKNPDRRGGGDRRQNT